LAVGQVVSDTGWAGSGAALGVEPESALREILGPEFYDKFFQLVDPEGRPGARSTHLREETLPLSAQARRDAARGEPTFETVRLATGEPVRLLKIGRASCRERVWGCGGGGVVKEREDAGA